MAEKKDSARDSPRRRFSEGSETFYTPKFPADPSTDPFAYPSTDTLSEPSTGPSVKHVAGPPIGRTTWLHKFNITDDDHCSVLVAVKGPHQTLDETASQIDCAMYTIIRKSLDAKYYSAGMPAFKEAKVSDTSKEVAAKVGEMAGITALAEEDTPKEIASLIHMAVTSLLMTVTLTDEDMVKAIRACVVMKVKLPDGEWESHWAEVFMPASPSIMEKICLSSELFESLAQTTKMVNIPGPSQKRKLSELHPEMTSVGSLLMRKKSMWNLLHGSVAALYRNTSVDASELISREEKTAVKFQDVIMTWLGSMAVVIEPELMVDVSGETLEKDVESFARMMVILASEKYATF